MIKEAIAKLVKKEDLTAGQMNDVMDRPLHQNQKHEQQEPPYQPSLILQEWYKYAVSYSLPLGQSPPH